MSRLDDNKNSLITQEDKDKAIIIENGFVVKNKNKFPLKTILISAGVGVVVTGSVVGYAIYKDKDNKRIANDVTAYQVNQANITENTPSKSEVFIETLNLRLADEDQFFSILNGDAYLYNEIEYTEKVETANILGMDIKWINEQIDIYGYAKAFFEYGFNPTKAKAESVNDNHVKIKIQSPFFRDETAHRIAGSYAPDPKKPNKTSGDAKRKTQLEVNYSKLMKTSNNIQQRAMIAWEDKFDKNIKPNIYELHKKDKTLEKLDKIAVEKFSKHIDSLNINKDGVKITIEVDKTIK